VDYNSYLFYIGFDLQFHMGAHKFSLEDEGTYAWSSNTNANGGADLTLYRDGANTLALRGGVNGGNTGAGQTFRIYNTYTSASQYERAYLGWNNNTFEIGVGTAGISTARSISLIGAAGSNTGDTLQPLQINQTWTTGTGIATALTLDVTDTSSSSSSKLLDLRVGGSHKFQVDKDGTIRNGSGGTWGTSQGMSLSGNYVSIQSGVAFRGNVGISILNWWTLGFNSGNIVAAPDVMFTRDSAGVMALRNAYVGTAQTFRIYRTSDTTGQYSQTITNYERLSFDSSSTDFTINTENGGTGTPKGLLFGTDGTTRVAITTDGYVGIGTTNPTEALEVAGNVKATKYYGEPEISPVMMSMLF
jgi:hypothetical protein